MTKCTCGATWKYQDIMDRLEVFKVVYDDGEEVHFIDLGQWDFDDGIAFLIGCPHCGVNSDLFYVRPPS